MELVCVAFLLHPDTNDSRTMELSGADVTAVKMTKEQKKLIRKQIKACNILLKHEGIRTASHVTKVIYTLQVRGGGSNDRDGGTNESRSYNSTDKTLQSLCKESNDFLNVYYSIWWWLTVGWGTG